MKNSRPVKKNFIKNTYKINEKSKTVCTQFKTNSVVCGLHFVLTLLLPPVFQAGFYVLLDKRPAAGLVGGL